MEGPTEEPEAIIPMEIVSNGGQNVLSSSSTGTTGLRRKAARRTKPWYLASPPPLPLQQNEDISARKKARLETPIDTAMALSPPDDVDDDDGANTDSVMDTQSNLRAAGATALWSPEEDPELTSAVANTHKTKGGKKGLERDWAAIDALVPGRTSGQCVNRCHNALNPSIARMEGCPGTWAEDEDIKLKGAIQTHGEKNWDSISVLLPGRTKDQCRNRWHHALNPSIDRKARCVGKWAEDEDSKLKDAVQTHGDKDWGTIAALVQGRTQK
jgi:hypothetical protein